MWFLYQGRVAFSLLCCRPPCRLRIWLPFCLRCKARVRDQGKVKVKVLTTITLLGHLISDYYRQQGGRLISDHHRQQGGRL